jgi:hypothetical protein
MPDKELRNKFGDLITDKQSTPKPGGTGEDKKAKPVENAKDKK